MNESKSTKSLTALTITLVAIGVAALIGSRLEMSAHPIVAGYLVADPVEHARFTLLGDDGRAIFRVIGFEYPQSSPMSNA